MLKPIIMRYFQFHEGYKEHGMRSTLQKLNFRATEFVPVVKELTELKSKKDTLSQYGLHFMEISAANLPETNLQYPVKSRYYKFLRYTKKGYNVFAVVKGDELLGDVCYMTAEMSKRSPIEDLEWFRIQLKENEAYMFDMFINADHRGKKITDLLLSHALSTLRKKGKKRAYGYYDSANIPALWFHRMHGYKELQKIRIQQFILFKRVIENLSETTTKNVKTDKKVPVHR